MLSVLMVGAVLCSAVCTAEREPIKAVMLISEGRSGSTTLMHTIRSASSAFVIAEPFYRFLNRNEPPPTLQELFNCSFLESPYLTKMVYWPYACKESHYFKMNEKVDACQEGKISFQDASELKKQCESAPIKLLKTIRFDGESNPFAEIIKDRKFNFQVLHLVRHPWKTIRSQIQRGWYGMDADEIQVEEVAKERCQILFRTSERLARVIPANNILEVRHEDLYDDPKNTELAKLLKFIGSNCAKCFKYGKGTVRMMKRKKHAFIPILVKNIPETWKHRVMTVDECKRFGFMYNY